MDYQRVYTQFIADRKNREPDIYRMLNAGSRRGISAMSSGEYMEHHHIIPVCIWPDKKNEMNDKSNMVALSPSDHLFAHMLLARIHGGKLWTALFLMLTGGGKSACGISHTTSKKLRRAYATARENTEFNRDIGNQMANNQKRIEGYRKWANETDISANVKERYKDPEYYARWKESQKDVWTDERRKAKGEASRKLWATDGYRDNIRRNKTPGSFTSEKLKAMWECDDFREKMKLRNPPPAHTMFQKGHEGHGKKRVVCVDTGEIFDSIVAAQKWCNENRGTNGRFNVAQTCRGEQGTAGGLKWAFCG